MKEILLQWERLTNSVARCTGVTEGYLIYYDQSDVEYSDVDRGWYYWESTQTGPALLGPFASLMRAKEAVERYYRK